MWDIIKDTINQPSTNLLITVGGFIFLKTSLSDIKKDLKDVVNNCTKRFKYCVGLKLTGQTKEED